MSAISFFTARSNAKPVGVSLTLSARLSLLLCTALLCACSTLRMPLVQPGDSESVVLARLGVPGAKYLHQEEQYWEYVNWPYGRQSFIARIGKDGKLVSLTQTLRTEVFATVQVGVANKQDVLRTLGRPYETSYLSLPKLEVWSYPYKEADAWDSMMHVHFDQQGVVKMMQNGPDPRFEEHRRWRMFR